VEGFVDLIRLIRSLQRLEGRADCFRRRAFACGEPGCAWRAYCLEEDLPEKPGGVRGEGTRRKGGRIMKAGIYFTGSGPIVILTSYDSLTHPRLVEKLAAKGMNKFVAYEVAMEEVKKKYGKHYEVIMKDLHQTDDLRVLDYDGHRVFRNFDLRGLGAPIHYAH
jgi:hypothetical protein